MTAKTALQGLQLPPASGVTTAVVVLLHGHGNNAGQLAQFAASLAPILPAATFYLPHGPLEVKDAPVGSRRWFSLDDYDREVARISAEGRAAMFTAVPDHIAQSALQLDAFLDQIGIHHGLPPSRIALVGFSQGSMMALYAGLRRKQQVAGILSYAGAVFATRTLANEIKSTPPVMLIHGADDLVVPAAVMTDAKAALESTGVPCQAHVVPTLRHSIDATAAQLGAGFLHGLLS